MSRLLSRGISANSLYILIHSLFFKIQMKLCAQKSNLYDKIDF